MARGASSNRGASQRIVGRSKSSAGAVQAKTSFQDRSRSYWRHHVSSLLSAFQKLVSSPLQTIMTSLVVAVALALPTLLWLTLNNLESLGESWDTTPKVSLYLHARSKERAIDNLLERLKAQNYVDELVYIDTDQALADFQRLSGFGEALSALDENPLPASIELTPKIDLITPDQLIGIAEELERDPLIDQAVVDMDWLRRLLEFMVLGKKIVYSLALLLGLGVLLAVGNTVRLEIENRRDEIVIAKLVGASDGFVRRPFLYTGAWYGVFGGLFAALAASLGFMLLNVNVERLVGLYEGSFDLSGLGLVGMLQLVTFSMLLGWLGAWLAVSRQLSSIKPT